MKRNYLAILVLLFSFAGNAQTINIPDANFKAFLLNHVPVIDINADDEIQASEALAMTQMFATSANISDLTGISAYATVMEDLLPDLSNSTNVPESMKKLVSDGANGISNAKGFYNYTSETAAQWEECFIQFSYEIRKLSEKYPQNIGDRIKLSEE